MSKSFCLDLPGEAFLVQDPAVKEQIDSNSRLLRFYIRCPAQGAVIAIHIFSIISKLATVSDYPGLRIASDNFMWMMDGISRLWDSLSAWEGLHMLLEPLAPLKKYILEALCKTLDNFIPLGISALAVSSTAMLSLHRTIEVLSQGPEKINEALEPVLAAIIFTLLTLSGRFSWLRQLLEKQLYPITLCLIKEEGQWSIFQKDFQVLNIFFLLKRRKN